MDVTHKSKGRPRAFDRDVALRRALEIFWQRGFESTSVAELCAAMEINPPSLYAAFDNKARLFLEAVQYYEDAYWAEPWRTLAEAPDLRTALERFFLESAAILSAQEVPCGCLVALATVNVVPESEAVNATLKALRELTYPHFFRRLERGIQDKALPPDTDIGQIAITLTALLHGMSIQARDGAPRKQLASIAGLIGALLPPAPETRRKAHR